MTQMKEVERQWLVTPIPLPDGRVAYLGMHWPCTEEDLILLRAGISLNLALVSYAVEARNRLDAAQALMTSVKDAAVDG